MSEFPKIAVLMGGPGSEREVSLASGKAVAGALRGAGLDAVETDVATTDVVLPGGTGLAYNLIHGTFGEDGRAAGEAGGAGRAVHRRGGGEQPGGV